MAVDVSMWSSEAWSSAADTYLLARAREGSDEAYAELWRRHLPTAYSVAHRYNGRAHAEDIVAEAATRVLALIREGRGPDENFRAYFLSSVRSVAVDESRRAQRVLPVADDELHDLLEPEAEPAYSDDFDPELVRVAFVDLPERDQRILWHTTVEGEPPRFVGPSLGLSANAASVRAMRARDALRVSYLEAYAAQHRHAADTPECRWALGVLGAHVRGRLPKRASDRLSQHLDGCERDTELVRRLRTIQDRFPALVVPLLLLAGAKAPGFLGGPGLAALGGGLAATEAGVVEGQAASVAEAVGTGSTVPLDGPVNGSVEGSAAPQTSHPAASGADALGRVATWVTSLAAVALVAAGPLAGGTAGVSDIAGPARAPGGTATAVTSTAPGATPDSGPSTTTPTTTVVTTTTATISPTTRPSPTSTATTRAPSPTLQPVSRGPGIDVRVISSGTPTRFSLRFSTSTAGDLKVSVANVSGAGRLTAENGAFTCRQTATSAVTCTGRGGHVLLEQSGLARAEAVVVRVTDAKGVTTTRTVGLG